MIQDSGAQSETVQQVAAHEGQRQAHARTESSLVATLSGTAVITADRAKLRGPFSKDVALELMFSEDRTQVGIGPIDIVTASGVHVISDGGTGNLYCPAGLIVIPMRVSVKKNGIACSLNLTLTTESGDVYGPFRPRGSRLQTDGSVTLATAAFGSVFGIGVNVLLCISGTVRPLP